jgi:hypothetical protein
VSVAFDEYDLIRSITRKSFYEFVREFWGSIVQEKYESNWHVKFLCDQVQEEVELILARKPKRYDYIIINIPPVNLKSTILMMMLNGWAWSRCPWLNFIGCSFEQSLAVGHALTARDLIMSDKYQRCFPDVVLRRDMKAKGTFGTTTGGRRYSAGTRGNITGKHGDIVVIDDPLNPKAARSQLETLAVKRFILEALPNRKRKLSIVPTFLIMQRLSEDDPTGFLLQMAKESPGKVRVKHICLPATYSSLVNPPKVKKYYDVQDGLLNPKRLDRQTLEGLKVNGEYFYAGQYDQFPIPAGGGMFKVEMIKTGIAPPDPNNPRLWVKQVRGIDKAGSYDEGCFTAGGRMGKDLNGNFWILHMDRYRQESCAREARIKRVATIDGKQVVTVLEQEPGSGGKGDAQTTVRNLAGFRVIKEAPMGKDPIRAEPLASQVNGGNVYLAPEGSIPGLPEPWHTALLNEMMFYPFSKYKDQVECLTIAFKHLTSSVFRVGFGKRKHRTG